MTRRISRRTWLASVPALGGLLLTGCSREKFIPPRVRGGLIGAADVLTMSSNRLLLSGQQLARDTPQATSPIHSPPGIRPIRRTRSINGTCRKGSGTGDSGSVVSSRARRVAARPDQEPGRPHADHRARVRTRMVGDWRMDWRAATGGPRSGRRGHAGGALRRHRHVRWLVRGIRFVRGRASADHPCLRPQRSRSSDRQRRTNPPAR